MLLAPRSTDVVVVAGLPGAGKTTLVASEPRALDSDAVREAWAPRLARLPYAVWRPLAHAWHWLALWRALARPDGVVVVRPFTTGWLRRAVLRRARRHHRAVHLVVVDATPAEARAGQLQRGRTVRDRAMRRHERRWTRADFAREQWTTVTPVPARSAPHRAVRRSGSRSDDVARHADERAKLAIARRAAPYERAVERRQARHRNEGGVLHDTVGA